MGISHSSFEEKLEQLKHSKGVKLDTDLTASDLKELVAQYKNVYLETKGEEFPSGTKYQPVYILQRNNKGDKMIIVLLLTCIRIEGFISFELHLFCRSKKAVRVSCQCRF